MKLKKYLKVDLNHQESCPRGILKGEEASYFIIVDNNSFKFFSTAQDHKRVHEHDKGPNTGGMELLPCTDCNEIFRKKIISKIIKPTLKALKENPYNGFMLD